MRSFSGAIARRAIGCCAVVVTLLASLSCGSSSQTITSPTQTRCAIAANGETLSFAPDGGSGIVRVSASRECSWSAQSGAAWLTLSPPVSGQGDGSVGFRVAANGDPGARTADISIGDERLQISQSGRPCTLRLSTTTVVVDASGGERTVEVESSSAQCRWTAASDVPWIVVTSGRDGTGNGVVSLRIEPAPGAPRSGSLTIAGQSVRVDQGTGSGCSVTLSPSNFGFGSEGGRGEVSISAASGCSWTARSQAPWIAVLGSGSGAGAGVVAFNVDPMDGTSRTGTIDIAGRTVTIAQALGCTYVVDPAGLAAPAAGWQGAVAVRAPAGCAWTASSAVDWITLAPALPGNGSGEARVTVAANPGPARSGELRIADRSVVVTQASGCSIAVSPPSISVGTAGASGAIQVSAFPGCTWSATAGAPWISIAGAASGSGNGQVQYAIAANGGPARDSAIAIGGRSVPVSQASACSYSITPPVQDVGGAGGTAVTSIATGAGCPWAAAGSVEWIVPATPSGVGPAQVSFNVGGNSGPARSGTATIAGQTFTINQASPCGWVFAPSSHDYGPSGGNGAILVIVTGLCSWTASSDVPWITVTSGASGTGGGLVQFFVAPNDGGFRAGSLTIAGQRYSVTQAGR